MKITRLTKTSIAASAIFALASAAHAGLILQYDSVAVGSTISGFTYGSATELSEIQHITDSAFVTSAADTSLVGSRGVMAAIHASQTNVQGAFGNQNDMMYRFGSSAGGNGTVSGALNVGHASAGARLDFSYTAAQAQSLDEFSFNLFNNSANGTSYGARDVGLFVQVAGGGFSQFGLLDTSATGNGNQGTIVFSGDLAVGSGDLVEFRLAFTDRTRTNNDLQAATRIGDVQIFATVPEPSTYALIGGLLVLTAVAMRRRQV